ncbi:MAG: glycogen-binding domain-containing protein [Spirochaetales bacterium]|nr:glycogen-binding domain-containing protein [Spirochaetales bacterium]
MLKKIFLLLGILSILSLPAFSEIKVKALNDGQAEITFLYEDSESPEMNVIGSFCDWSAPGLPMTKNSDGIWEYKLLTFPDDEIVYKFYIDGNYISDPQAPAQKDDGYAGMNGLIIVADLLAATPLSTDVTTAPVVKTREKSTFSTTTYIESDTSFTTVDSKHDAVDSSINAKSIWKFKGDIVANMPAYMELTFFDGSASIWNDANDLEITDGLETLASGFIFNPVYYLGDSKRPALDKFTFGFDTKYIAYESGYGNSTIPKYSSIIWESIKEDETIADDGYSKFSTSQSIESIGLDINAGIIPNKSLSDFYSLFSYLNASIGSLEADIEYEMKSSTTDSFQDVFTDITRQDLILGVGYKLNSLMIKVQTLSSTFLETSPLMDRPFEDRLGVEGSVEYSEDDLYSFVLGYKLRGYAAQFLYANTDDILGLQDTQTVYLNSSYTINESITPKLNMSFEMADENPADSNIKMNFVPGAKFILPQIAGLTIDGDIYADISINSKPEEDETPVILVGAKFNSGDYTLNYGLDRSNSDIMFNTLLLEVKLPQNLTTEVGIGIRSGSDIDYPFGFSIGTKWEIPSAKSQKPHLYANYVYNIDPYLTGTDSADLSDYRLSNNSEGEAAFRFGIVWDY